MGLFSKERARGQDVSPPVKMLITDHEKAERIFDEIKAADSTAQRQALVAQLDAELTRHTTIEERVLYPFVRSEVEGGPELIEEAEREHAEAKAVLERVATLDVSTEDFGKELTQLEKLVSHHVDEEEKELFPKLEESTGDEQLMRLRRDLETARGEESPSPQLPADSRRRAPVAASRTTPRAKSPSSRPRGRGGRTSKSGVWVQPHHTDDNRWQVRRETASRASRVFDTQSEAEDFGRQLARREKVELVVAGRDGEIRKKQSYGNDPVNIKG